MAAAGQRPIRPHRPGPLDQPGADRRARHLRLGLPRRRPGAVGQRGTGRRRARADCPAHRAGRGDQSHRAHRYRVYHLQRPVQSGPQVRLAGPRQRPGPGWNIVTTATKNAAQNFGLDDVPGHQERYRRAAEFTDVSIALWDSWEDGAEIGDKATGIYADVSRIHPVDLPASLPGPRAARPAVRAGDVRRGGDPDPAQARPVRAPSTPATPCATTTASRARTVSSPSRQPVTADGRSA